MQNDVIKKYIDKKCFKETLETLAAVHTHTHTHGILSFSK